MATSDPAQNSKEFDSVVRGEFPVSRTIIIEGPPWAIRLAIVATFAAPAMAAVVASDLRARRIAKMAARAAQRRH
jgi:hypothetical protein